MDMDWQPFTGKFSEWLDEASPGEVPAPGSAAQLDAIDRLHFTAGAAQASNLYDAIGDRHSNRGPYTNAAVARLDLDTLNAQTNGLAGVAMHWFTTAAERAALG